MRQAVLVDTGISEGNQNDGEIDNMDMGADEHWVRDADESAALERLRGVLGEQVCSSDEMQSLVRSVGSEARCFLRYLRLHSVSLVVEQCYEYAHMGC